MKTKIISIVLLFLFFLTAGYAQTGKGTIILSGKTDLNFLFSKTTISRDSIATNTLKSNQFAFNLGAGYFVANNIVVALSGAYSYTDNKSETLNSGFAANETITTTLAVVPQLIYYFSSTGKLRPSLSAGIGIVWLKERDTKVSINDHTVYSLAGPSFNAAGGLSYFITRSVAFEIGLQYSHNRLKDKINTGIVHKQNTVAPTLGVTIFFLK